MNNRPLLALLTLLLAAPLQAENLRLVALFGDKAAIIIDGKQTIIRIQQADAPLLLLKTSTDAAWIELNGQRQKLQLGESQIVAHYQAPQRKQVHIFQNSLGMYQSSGKINNRSTEFLIDTGASVVAINRQDAQRFGIDTDGGKKVLAQTASGQSEGRLVMLNSISIGTIQLYNIPAVVLEGSSPKRPLLGMSFLQHLNVTQQQRRLLLEQLF